MTRNLQSRIAANDHALFSVSFSQDNTSSRPISAGDVVVAMETGGPHSSAMDLEISLLEASGLALEAVFSPGVVSGEDRG